jgi:hypothetical protein
MNAAIQRPRTDAQRAAARRIQRRRVNHYIRIKRISDVGPVQFIVWSDKKLSLLRAIERFHGDSKILIVSQQLTANDAELDQLLQERYVEGAYANYAMPWE